MVVDVFYLLPTNPNVGDKAYLYAFTNKKEYAKLFESQRDMSKFIHKRENKTKEEYYSMESDPCLRKSLLIYNYFHTRNILNFSSTMQRKLLCTVGEEFEILKVYDKTMEEAIYKFTCDFRILKDKYIDALDDLLYTYFDMARRQTVYDIYLGLDTDTNSFNKYSYKLDEIAFYVTYFKHLYK